MSLISRRRLGQNLDESNLRQSLNDAIKVLDSNCKVIGKLTEDIGDVEDILTMENDMILEEIDKNVHKIRQVLNEYVENIQTDLRNRFNRNIKCLREFETKLRQELKICAEDKSKCENSLRDLEKDDVFNVNKTKVMEMALSSINARKFTSPGCELKRTVFGDTGADKEILRIISEMVGTLTSRQETLQETKHPAVLKETFEIADTEVNAVALTAEKNSTHIWINQGVSSQLQCYSNSGKLLNTINTDFKVNDIDVNTDDKILATSTDCCRIRCIKPMKNGKNMQIYSITDKLYLHSLTVSRDGETIVACGTDAPNYSNQAPNEVVIVEYSPPGRELKRIAISGYTGKVYRFVQNGDSNYVLTFPKDGTIVSVNGSNGEITATFDSSDFLRCHSKHIKATGDAVFWPSGLCCNSRGHIFVTEWVNQLLLMLDEDCHFLRYIGSNHLCPNAVCYNKYSDTLWLGDKGRIKVWDMKQMK